MELTQKYPGFNVQCNCKGVNLVLSLILIKPFGISGILFATIFSFLTGNFIFYPRIIYKEILKDKVLNYYKEDVF